LIKLSHLIRYQLTLVVCVCHTFDKQVYTKKTKPEK